MNPPKRDELINNEVIHNISIVKNDKDYYYFNHNHEALLVPKLLISVCFGLNVAAVHFSALNHKIH